jgi:hypothetical protein
MRKSRKNNKSSDFLKIVAILLAIGIPLWYYKKEEEEEKEKELSDLPSSTNMDNLKKILGISVAGAAGGTLGYIFYVAKKIENSCKVLNMDVDDVIHPGILFDAYIKRNREDYGNDKIKNAFDTIVYYMKMIDPYFSVDYYISEYQKSIRELFKILGLPFNSSDKEINTSYRKLSLIHHPDKGGTVKNFQKINNAKETLLYRVKFDSNDKQFGKRRMRSKKRAIK